MDLFGDKVRVTFIDGNTGALIGVSEMAGGELPAAFLERTTLHIGADEWSVVSADPPTRHQFLVTRELRLTVTRSADPDEVLFSLPTICDELPDIEGPLDGTEVVIHDDHWRQVELIAAKFRPEVEAEFIDIQAIRDWRGQEAGFTEIHLRHRVRRPLEGCGLRIEAVPGWSAGSARPIRFEGHNMRVADGFAVMLRGGGFVYGTCVTGVLEILAFARGVTEDFDAVAIDLDAYAVRNGLLLVDWVRCAVGEPGTSSFPRIVRG